MHIVLVLAEARRPSLIELRSVGAMSARSTAVDAPPPRIDASPFSLRSRARAFAALRLASSAGNNSGMGYGSIMGIGYKKERISCPDYHSTAVLYLFETPSTFRWHHSLIPVRFTGKLAGRDCGRNNFHGDNSPSRKKI